MARPVKCGAFCPGALKAASANDNVEVVDMLLAVEANVHAASHDESTIQILDMWPCDPIDLFSADNLFNAEDKYACSVEFLQKSKAGWGTVGLTLDVAFPPVVVAERYTGRCCTSTAGSVLRGAPGHDDR